MQVRKKKILIETKTEERLLVLITAGPANRPSCPDCSGSRLLYFDEAVGVSGIPTTELYAHAKAGTVHSMGSPSGHLLICANSLGVLAGCVGTKPNE
jgi:hypothetical protein